jgi:hypothetical protein
VSSANAAFAADPDQGTPRTAQVPAWAGVVTGLVAALGGLAALLVASKLESAGA